MTAGFGLGQLSLRSTAQTRSISAENVSGEKGRGAMAEDGTGAYAAGNLGRGWKVSPSVKIAAGDTYTIADITGSGIIQHIWMTTHYHAWRKTLLRFYWENDSQPAVEVPLGDFFCNGWGQFSQVSSLPVAVNPNGGFNSYWEMPFRRAAKITLENLGDEDVVLYYQVDYSVTEVAEEASYFHAQWRRSNPLPYQEVHTVLDGVRGAGHYVGTYLAWGVNNSGWWGEGEIKFFLDGDQEFPTICGTGTEDYFGGAWNFDVPEQGYTAFTTPFLGLNQVLRPDGLYRSQQRFGMYRWHIPDPIRFTEDVRVTIQALGWRGQSGRYLPLQDDIASTAFWYLDTPAGQNPATPHRDHIEVI
ncbi:glycoside hydrolase family 172 protein [Fodinicola acaciae]|uniref:glycoside hydrolase family 172 protein n=1 Tax=Fodinicola acaciae TaxID=2681555 RepID=UPI001FEC87D2|nr:glycoside hydrolase family 172 protein [Fodinicola acaciae]